PFRVVDERPPVSEQPPLPLDVPAPPASQNDSGPQPSGRKKGRTAMPSWDEIVFGARTDDDLA
ncbi:hypothetical protein SB767_29290, partial [Bacillus sp. SIMBA_069]